MKLRKSGQVFLAAVVSVGVGLGLTSCGASNTVDYVFITSSKNNPGQINVYRADSLSGALTQIPDSPYSSQGRNPVAEVTAPNGKSLYVINHDDNTVVQFAIGTDGKLYPQHTCNTPGSEPNAVAINSAGTLLFVADYYAPTGPGQAPFSAANPGPGDLTIYPLNADGSMGPSANCTPVAQPAANGTSLPYVALGLGPSGINVLANGASVYVTQTGQESVNGVSTTAGQIAGFQVDSSGVLTAAPGSPYPAGTQPSAIASDPTSRFLYVTDSKQNQLTGYTIASTGLLSTFASGPVNTDVFPDAIVVDPQGKFIYVANYTANDVSAYAINQSTGVPSSLAATSAFGTDTGPTCIIIDPGLGRFIYTSNFLGNSVTGLTLDPNAGTLSGNQNSPYPTAGQSTCAAAIPHGNHATQHVQAGPGQ